MLKRRRPVLQAAAHVEKDESEVRWLISYSDFMMQLLCLFILLYSVASIDPAKIARIASAYRAHVGVVQPPGAERSPDGSRLSLGDRPLVGGELPGVDVPRDLNVRVEEVPGGWRLGFSGELFDRGSAELTAAGKAALDEAASFLAAYAGQGVVTGYPDEDPGDGAALAAARAASATAHLVRTGFPKAMDPRFVRAVGGAAGRGPGALARRVTIELRVD